LFRLNVVAKFGRRRKWLAPPPPDFSRRAVGPAEIDASQPELHRRRGLGVYWGGHVQLSTQVFQKVVHGIDANSVTFYKNGEGRAGRSCVDRA